MKVQTEVFPFDVYSVTSYSAYQAIMRVQFVTDMRISLFAASYRYNMDCVVLNQCCVKACSAFCNFMSILLIYCPHKL